MSEEPKSIWKKSLGRNWLGSLLMALASSTVIVVIGAMAGLFPGDVDVWIMFVLVSWPLIAFIRWLCCWRNFKRFVFAVICLITLVALVGAEETWRGKRALEKFKQEWTVRGEKFDYKNFVPPVEDEQNFAVSPIVASSYEYYFDRHGHEKSPRDTNVVDRLTMLSWSDYKGTQPPKNQGWPSVKGTDLQAWQKFFRAAPTADAPMTNPFPMTAQPQSPAADVLLALTRYDAAIAELRLAAKLPESRFPLTYDKENPGMILLPHLSALRSSAEMFALRATAELQLGQAEAALADLRLALKLADASRTDPVLISHLVRVALLQISLQPVYEGLAKQSWSDEQLKTLESELAKINLLSDYQYAMRGERILGVAGLEYFRRSRDANFLNQLQNSSLPKSPSKLVLWFSRLIVPDGFFYQNELTVARMHQQFTLPMVDTTNDVVLPAKVRSLQKEAMHELTGHWSPYTIFARMTFPALEKSAEKFVMGQDSLNLARTAIALERYRLAHGEFPESLDALAPQFIAQVPHDVIGGAALKYRREKDGTFTLYSIGWNERDDGGVVVFSKGETPSADFKQGDWVWRYPARGN